MGVDLGFPATAGHFPVEEPPFRLAMGLAAVDPDDLTEVDARYPAQIAERAALLDGPARDDVLGWLPDTEASRAQVWERVSRALERGHPGLCPPRGGRDALEAAGRAVVEDLCVLRPGPDGPELVAGVVCFPGRWRLRDKLGRSMSAIHAPVPLYEERLRRPVDRFFGLLAAGKMVSRRNWSVVADAALHQLGPGRGDEGAGVTAATAGSLTLRVERQTLSRLEGGDVLFTIGTHATPLAEVCADPGRAARLLAAVEALPAAMRDYKGMAPFDGALREWLRAKVG